MDKEVPRASRGSWAVGDVFKAILEKSDSLSLVINTLQDWNVVPDLMQLLGEYTDLRQECRVWLTYLV